MKSQTLTSSLALGLYLTGTAVIAMDVDILTQSMCEPRLVRQMLNASKDNATDEERLNGKKAAEELDQKLAARKIAKIVPPEQALTADEQKELAELHTSALSLSDKPNEKVETAAPSWFWGWLSWGSKPTPTVAKPAIIEVKVEDEANNKTEKVASVKEENLDDTSTATANNNNNNNLDLVHEDLKKFAAVPFTLLDTNGSGRAKTKAQNIEREGSQIKVTTDNNKAASYQLESDIFLVTPGETIRVPYDITVEAGGRMSLGLLRTDTKGWYGPQVFLGAGHHKDVFERIVPVGETKASLVLRNAHLKTPGQTTFSINNIDIEKK